MKGFLFLPGLFLLWPFAGGGAQTGADPVASGNHLLHEKSPYLLQHAHNPVDWYPWGEEAFAKARRENKPIFLSIGYSTCHWCHVMERESFENPAIARLLNDSFVAIKVDREERPDVDATYMTFVAATTGSGGWPMTVFAAPDLKPFAGGTYFPPTDRDGQPGLATILPEIAAAWKEHRAGIVAQAGEITAKLQELNSAGAGGSASGETGPPGKATLAAGFTTLAASFDAAHGGFGRGGGPKFPQPMNLNFLTRVAVRQGAGSADGKQALAMDFATLRAMAAGGIHDHLGGGFHRYSTDPRWHVPHFEKMLYDQAQLAIAYLEAYQLSGDPAFATVARDTLDYMRHDLCDPVTGAFFSAEDADSQPTPGSTERAEGAFYVWKAAEIAAGLGASETPLFEAAYGIKAAGNVPAASDARGELAGENVLDATGHAPAELAAAFHLQTAEIGPRLAHDRATLLAWRNQRPRPRRDDKAITAWNGLAISAFARAAAVLDDPAYLETARRASAFLQTHSYDAKTGGLTRSYLQGPGPSEGYANDYAFLIQGLLDLYAADFDVAHLAWAQGLQSTEDRLFWDDKAGGYFDTALGQDRHVFLRTKNGEDNAEPSASAVSALNLGRLGQLLENDDATQRARRTIGAFSPLLHESPVAAPEMLVALDFAIGPDQQIVVAGRPGAPETLAVLRVIRRLFLPASLLILADGGPGQAFFSRQVSSFKDIHPIEDGRATAYVCQNFACQQPTTDLTILMKLLQK